MVPEKMVPESANQYPSKYGKDNNPARRVAADNHLTHSLLGISATDSVTFHPTKKSPA
jgi:hypothetical protein